MDLSETTAPRSDQLNFDDVAHAPLTVTVAEVRAGTAEQPVEIHLSEYPGRPFKPSKTVRRILVAAWGKDSSLYTFRRMTLFGDASVKFGGATVGGIRVSHLSHLDEPLKLNLTTTRGKRAIFTVLPLEDAPTIPEPTEAQVAASTDQNELREYWQHAGPERRAQITQRVNELKEES